MAKKRQFGSVRKIDGGRWQARCLDPLTGRRIPAPHTFKTKAEASRWLARLESQILDPSSARQEVDCDIRLSDYATTWLAERPLKPRTRETYTGQFRLHVAPELGNARIARLRPEHVRTWHARLLATGSLHPVTVAKVYRLMRTILGTAVVDGLIPANPCQIPGAGVEHSAERPIPDLAVVQAIAQAMPNHLAAAVWLAALGGLRKGEVLGLARRHIDLVAGTVRIERALQEINGEGAVMVSPKTHSSRRTVALPRLLVAELSHHLESYVAESTDALLFTNSFGRPIRATVWTTAIDRARAEAGASEFRFHDLRHLAGTLTTQAGATLKETMNRLGHSSPAAALRYQHVVESRKRAIATMIDALVQEASTELVTGPEPYDDEYDRAED